MKIQKYLIFAVGIFFTGQCNNFGLLDKLENPGGSQSGAPRKIFVSSLTTTGSMANFITVPGCTGLGTGLPPADCVCKVMATNAGLANSNNFIAFMSDGANDVRCRIQGISGNVCGAANAGPWYNTKGNLVAKDYGTLLSGALSSPVQYTESGMAPPAAQVFTGTNQGGSSSGSNCTNWSSVSGTPATVNGGTVGNPNAIDGTWADMGTPALTAGCSGALPVYCVETK